MIPALFHAIHPLIDILGWWAFLGIVCLIAYCCVAVAVRAWQGWKMRRLVAAATEARAMLNARRHYDRWADLEPFAADKPYLEWCQYADVDDLIRESGARPPEQAA